jgi:predicted amino acid dehydrogenase
MLGDGEIIACDSTMQFTAKTGSRCSGKEWTIPLTPEMILRNQNLAVEMTAKACQRAQEWGADIVGLGLMLGKVGRRGQDVKDRVDISITNGDSYLVFHAAQVVNNLLNFLEWQPETTKIAVYGFPSTIGTTLTEYLLSQGMGVVLIARETAHVQKLMRNISERYETPVELATTFSQALQETSIVLTAGSAVQKLNPDDIDAPLIVVDVSFPRNVFRESNKMLVIDANSIPLPKELNSAAGYLPERTPTCLAELILLSLEGKKESFSLGRTLSLEKINEIGTLAKRNGFVTDILYSFDKPIEVKRLNYFKAILTG